MKATTRSRITAGLSALALSLGLAVASPIAATAAVWQEDYYHNYFYSFQSCDKRGYAMKHYEKIQGFLSWHCHRHPSEVKWSMDVYWAT